MFKKFLKRFYDLPNAFRVLEIMDNAGCDIEEIPGTYLYRIRPKWYVSKKEAEDLRTIILYKEQVRKRSKIWNKVFFRNIRRNSRVL